MKKLVFGILFTVVCTTFSALAASNGSGYNGPDLNPVSIPVSLDRGISIGELESAVNTCLVSGNATIGLKSTISDLADELGVTMSSENNFQATWYLCDLEGFHSICSIFTSEAQDNTVVFHGPSLPDGGNLPITFEYSPQGQLSIGLREIVPGTITVLTTNDPFPFVSYGKILQDGGFDDFGNPDSTKTIVSQLMIQVPASFQTNGQAVPLINYSSKATTKFTLNAQEYVQCLQTELQTQSSGSK